MSQVTQILESLDSDDPKGAEDLLPLVYEKLRRLAEGRMARERKDHTLDATSLVHEAWIKLLGPDGAARKWNGRRHFYAAAAEAMRRILIDHARKKMAGRRGGDWFRVTFGDYESPRSATPPEILDLHTAMEKLERSDPVRAEVAKLRLFAGLTQAETAEALGLAQATIARRWSFAKAWLARELKRDETNDGGG